MPLTTVSCQMVYVQKRRAGCEDTALRSSRAEALTSVFCSPYGETAEWTTPTQLDSLRTFTCHPRWRVVLVPQQRPCMKPIYEPILWRCRFNRTLREHALPPCCGLETQHTTSLASPVPYPIDPITYNCQSKSFLFSLLPEVYSQVSYSILSLI